MLTIVVTLQLPLSNNIIPKINILSDFNLITVGLRFNYYMSKYQSAPFMNSKYRWYSVSAIILPSSWELTWIVLFNPGNFGATKYPRSG